MNKNKRLRARIEYYANLLIKGHLLNPLWASHYERRRRRYRATITSAMKYFQLYADAVEKMDPDCSTQPTDEPERVFTLWLQGEEAAPPIVKACLRSMRRHLRQELVVLDEKTLFEWISLPGI